MYRIYSTFIEIVAAAVFIIPTSGVYITSCIFVVGK